jgi:hypothetical protein
MALTAAACSGTGPPPSASSSALPKTTLTACTEQGLAAKCENVRVPQDWAHPAGPAMKLQVVVLPATAASHPAAPCSTWPDGTAMRPGSATRCKTA